MGVAGGARGSRLGGKKNSFNKMPLMEEVRLSDSSGDIVRHRRKSAVPILWKEV